MGVCRERAHPMGSPCQGVLLPHGSRGDVGWDCGNCGGIVGRWSIPGCPEDPRAAVGPSLLRSGCAQGLLEVTGLQQSRPCWPGNHGLLSQEVLSNPC